MNKKDLIAAAIFIVTGLAFSIYTWFGLKIGRAARMGEGYFPFVLGFVLVALGLLVAFKALNTREEGWGAISWRGLLLITAAIVFFGVGIRHLGLVPALAGSIVIAAMATRDTTPWTVIGLAVGLTAFCVGVFTYGLGMPLDLVGPWLRFG
jgi:hypothetical protein